MLAAVGCSWVLKSFGVLWGEDYGGVIIAREIPVTVREVDRRVLIVCVDTEVGLITCVRSRTGQAARHSTPVSRGARGWPGHRQKCRRRWRSWRRTWRRCRQQEGDEWMTQLTRIWRRDDNVFEKCATLILVPWAKQGIRNSFCPTLPQFPGGQNDPTHDMHPVSRDWRVRTLMELCQLRFACYCWMLLNPVNPLDWWESRWRRLGTSVAVRDIDRRVLQIHVADEVGELGLITCVSGWISHSAWLTPASGRAWAYAPTSCHGCVDAEGLDNCAVDEERTDGKRTTGTFNNDLKERDGCESLKMTRTLIDLEASVLWPHLEMCGWVAVVLAREKCACVPGNFCVHSPSRSVSCVWLDAKRNLKN